MKSREIGYTLEEKPKRNGSARKNNVLPISQRRLVSAREGSDYTGIGTQHFRLLCREIGAEIRIGGRLLYDRPMVDAWIESQKPGNAV